MPRDFELVLSGDALLNNRVSTCEDPGFRDMVELLRGADVTHTQLEVIIHNLEGPETYPSAEGAWSWISAPKYVTEELKWCGVDMVSTPSNHSLDFSYGGLRQTWDALNEAGIPHAGTGKDLAAARMPAFLDTKHARVALVSACSSFPMFARAGAARPDMQGRPGVNPLRYYHRVDQRTADEIIETSRRLGMWVTQVGDEFTVNPAGIHNTLWRYAISDEPGLSTVCDEDDLAGNLAAIRHALAQADFVIAHLHTHEWNLDDGRISTTAAFAEDYARAAIDEGAQIVVLQGSHAPMRGIEIYKGRVIFYDPGDLFRLGGRGERQPDDFYKRWGYGPEARQPNAGLPEGIKAREAVFGWGDGAKSVISSPKTLYSHEPGFFVPVCTIGEDFRVERVTIHPGVWLEGNWAHRGLPAVATGAKAQAVLEHLQELCEPYGTQLRVDGDVAHFEVDATTNLNIAQEQTA